MPPQLCTTTCHSDDDGYGSNNLPLSLVMKGMFITWSVSATRILAGQHDTVFAAMACCQSFFHTLITWYWL